MAQANATSTSGTWTSSQAYILAAVCLLAGVMGGWLFRGSQSSAAAAAPETSAPSSTSAMGTGQPTPEQMKKMADTQAAPLIEKLKSDPENPDLLAQVGNVYYDTQQFPTAIDYYQRVLKSQPSNTGVRTDLATAYWYTGDADTAISQFNQALTYEPTKANTLYNLGIVRWQGKMDIEGAVAAWQKLLDTNPNYEHKDKILDLIAQAKKHTGVTATSRNVRK